MPFHKTVINISESLHFRATYAISKRAASALVSASLLALALGACGKADNGLSTAERVKLVEEKQKVDPNFHLPRKSADTPVTEPVKAAPTSAQVAPSKASAVLR